MTEFSVCYQMKAITINSLTVLIKQEIPGVWEALGIDIYIVAAGGSLEEVQANFEKTLIASVRWHLMRHNNLDRLLKPAPQDAIEDFVGHGGHEISNRLLSKHETSPSAAALVAKSIDYYEAA